MFTNELGRQWENLQSSSCEVTAVRVPQKLNHMCIGLIFVTICITVFMIDSSPACRLPVIRQLLPTEELFKFEASLDDCLFLVFVRGSGTDSLGEAASASTSECLVCNEDLTSLTAGFGGLGFVSKDRPAKWLLKYSNDLLDITLMVIETQWDTEGCVDHRKTVMANTSTLELRHHQLANGNKLDSFTLYPQTFTWSPYFNGRITCFH